MARERCSHTLQATALVNEAWIRLAQWSNSSLNTDRDFLRVAVEIMRHILVDAARQRRRRKGLAAPIPVEELPATIQSVDLVELDDALEWLGRRDSRATKVIELHFFGQMTFSEIARFLDISESTAKRDWNIGRTHIRRAMALDGLRE